VAHPLFARVFDRVSRMAEKKGQADHRRELLAGLEGRVLELGAGNGLNFAHYPTTVTEIVAVEPEPYLRERAEKAAGVTAVPVRVVDGLAGGLPYEPASFDAAVVSLVLCSVPDPEEALDELFRIVRPGGELRFYEHVRSERPAWARLQRAVDVVWPRVNGGCHTHRDTAGAIEQAGWQIGSCRRLAFRPCAIAAPVTPHLLGVARRPDRSPPRRSSVATQTGATDSDDSLTERKAGTR
jgi:SAM-dependent methyltransferase